jgi:hypothetical protein
MQAQQTYLPVGPWSRLAQLSVLGLMAVYGSVVLGEFVAGEGLASNILGSADLPVMLTALFIHTLITLPVAYVVGYGLVRCAPVVGPKAVTVVVLLWSTFIVVLQLAVYEPSVAGLSVLKVLCVVAPLLVGRSIAHRTLARKTDA